MQTIRVLLDGTSGRVQQYIGARGSPGERTELTEVSGTELLRSYRITEVLGSDWSINSTELQPQL